MAVRERTSLKGRDRERREEVRNPFRKGRKKKERTTRPIGQTDTLWGTPPLSKEAPKKGKGRGESQGKKGKKAGPYHYLWRGELLV